MPQKTDILNRQNFINNLIQVTRQLADNHEGCTFAIDGKWGSGKTYILDAFEEEIGLFPDPNAAGDRYIVFRYNCWQYDYYDEPAIAIIAAIRDAAEAYQKLFPSPPLPIKAMLEVAKDLGVDLVSNVIETKFGWSPEQIIDLAKEYQTKKGEVKAKIKETHNYDTFFEFKAVLNKTKKQLSDMAKDKPIIILVDELDRCMPEYAIKVLERLHHLFENQPNIVVILAYDQPRLSHTIQNLYGIKDEDVPHFMKKFISFSLHLDAGEISEAFWENYKNYLDNFDIPEGTDLTLLHELPVKLFSGIDIRTQEKIMARIEMLHKLACADFSDLSVLFYELLHQVLTYRCPQMPIGKWIVELNHITFGGLEETLGSNLYKYIKSLESGVHHGRTTVLGSFGRPTAEYDILTGTPLSTSFLYFAAINHPLIDGKYCNKYSLQKPIDDVDQVIEATQRFDQLASLIK